MPDQIETVLNARLGDADRAVALAAAYREGVVKWAVGRTTGGGPVPTTLVAERVDLLLAVTLALEDLLSEREIAALLRVTASGARRLSSDLRAVYEDVIQPFVYSYALDGAQDKGAGDYNSVDGQRIAFASEAQLQAFLTEAKRTAVPVSRKRGEPELPFLLYVDQSFPFADHGL